MNRSRRMLVAALGAMTPALLLEAGAMAHAANQTGITEIQLGAPNIGPGHEAMKNALLALSPADKLRLAGDRIRLAKANKKKAQGKRPQGIYQVIRKRPSVDIPCEYTNK